MKFKKKNAPAPPELYWEFRCITIDRPGEFCTWDPDTDTSTGTIPCSPSDVGSGKPGDPICRPASTQYVINDALRQFPGWEIQSFWITPLWDGRSRHHPLAEIWLKRKFFRK